LCCAFSFWAALSAPAAAMAAESPPSLTDSAGHSYPAERVYQITETELTQLERSLARQETSLLKALDLQKAQGAEFTALKAELQAALKELAQSKKEIESLKTSLNSALNSIESANQYFTQYAKEMKKERSRLRRQRTIWQAVGGLAFCGALWAAAK
jgi:septal ring factor EnvC (AmiA/AmiB activator)